MKDRHQRQSFLGPNSDEILAACTVGVVGLGGGGSHLAQQLAHLGVGSFLLVDPDKVEETNLNRLVGATAKDADDAVFKTVIASRLIGGIDPSINVETAPQKWQECHQLLRTCDIIFGSVDTYRDRYELEVTARRYLIPYLDIGMDVHQVGKEFVVAGQVILSLPGTLCMRCLGFLRDELLTREAQNYHAAGARPQVIWANGILASVAVGIFTQLFVPWHDSHEPTAYLEYDGNSQSVKRSSRLEFLSGKVCQHFSSVTDLGDPFWIPEEITS